MEDKDLSYDKISDLLNKKDNKDENKRKKKADWLSKAAAILSLFAWTIMIAVWAVLEAAAPERERRFITSFFDVQFGTPPLIREIWDYTLVYIACVLLLVSLGTCAIAFFINRMRMKRKSDRYKISIFIAGGINVIVLVVFLIHFWSVLF